MVGVSLSLSVCLSYVHLSEVMEDSDGELAILEPITMTTNNLTGRVQVRNPSEDWEGIGRPLQTPDDIGRVWMPDMQEQSIVLFLLFLDVVLEVKKYKGFKDAHIPISPLAKFSPRSRIQMAIQEKQPTLHITKKRLLFF